MACEMWQIRSIFIFDSNLSFLVLSQGAPTSCMSPKKIDKTINLPCVGSCFSSPDRPTGRAVWFLWVWVRDSSARSGFSEVWV